MNLDVEILPIGQTSVQLPQVWNLIQETYAKRLQDSGVEFNLLRYSYKMFADRISDEQLTVLVATNADKELLGTRTLRFHHNRNIKYAEGMWLAVSPRVQGKGVGSKLLLYGSDFAIEQGCDFVIEDTAVAATSSVRMHEKNRYYIYGFASFESTNYYSIVFRNQIGEANKLYSYKWFCHLRFVLSWLYVKATKKANGDRTALGKVIHLLKR